MLYLSQSFVLLPPTAYTKASSSTREKINPDEVKALSWSGQLDVMEEAVDEAGEKLVRLQRLCGANCPEYKNLKSAIDNLGTEN